MRRCVIFNPAARGEQARALGARLQQLRESPTLLPTAAPGDASRLATQAAADGFDVVVAAGGDGTLNEVVHGLDSAIAAGVPPRLGVLPLGTANVFALEYGLPFDLTSAWDVVLRGRERPLDVAYARFQGARGGETRSFVQLAGAGLDAHAVFLVNWRLKKLVGKTAYVWAAVQARCRARGGLRVTVDSRTHEARWVLIGNGALYAGRYRFFPQARPDDGLLDLCLFQRLDWLFLARCWLRLATGGPLDLPGVIHLQAPAFELASDTAPHLELDGEYVGSLPASFHLRPKALQLLA